MFYFQSLTVASGDSRREEAERKTSREEADRSHNTLASLASQHSTSATLSSVKSVRNYKRTRPASQMPEEKAPVGLSESLPHVYQDGTGSYFSWLHLFGKSKRRYNVSRRKNPNRGPKTAQYRQTRYRHIAESRNSAVIPTRIAKRASTASTFNVSQALKCIQVREKLHIAANRYALVSEYTLFYKDTKKYLITVQMKDY